MNMKRQTIAASIAILGLLVTALPARAQDASEKLAGAEQTFRKGIVAIRTQIDTTLGSLDGIVKGKSANDRKSALKKYSADLKDMQKQIDQTEKYAKDMQTQGASYFKNWDKSMKGVTNADLKASAEERKTAMQAKTKRIQDDITLAKGDGPAFRKNLSDLEDFFGKSVSSDAVATSGKLVDSTTASGKKIQGYLDDILAAIDGKPAAGSKPADAAAAAATTAAAPAADAKPAEAKPAEAPAAEAKAAEEKPAEEKPAEAKPAEAKAEEPAPEAEKAPETPKPPPQAPR
jgi:hypothetical protein